MMRLYVFENKVDMDEITFQAECSYKHKASVEPMGSAAEDTVEQQDAGDGKRDVEHALQKEWKHAVFLLLQEDACHQGHQEHEPYHPYRCAIQRLFLSHHLSHVDADEEDRYTTPEYLKMSYGMMDGRNVLHQDAPHNHHHRQPSVDRMPFDEFHVGWGKEIEHHRGRNIPEVKLVVQPEPPVNGYLAQEIDPIPGASAVKARNIEETSDDEPGGIDAQIAADEEMPCRRSLHPREPQSYSAEE